MKDSKRGAGRQAGRQIYHRGGDRQVTGRQAVPRYDKPQSNRDRLAWDKKITEEQT